MSSFVFLSFVRHTLNEGRGRMIFRDVMDPPLYPLRELVHELCGAVAPSLIDVLPIEVHVFRSRPHIAMRDRDYILFPLGSHSPGGSGSP